MRTLLHEESGFEPPIERANRSLLPDYEVDPGDVRTIEE